MFGLRKYRSIITLDSAVGSKRLTRIESVICIRELVLNRNSDKTNPIRVQPAWKLFGHQSNTIYASGTPVNCRAREIAPHFSFWALNPCSLRVPAQHIHAAYCMQATANASNRECARYFYPRNFSSSSFSKGGMIIKCYILYKIVNDTIHIRKAS